MRLYLQRGPARWDWHHSMPAMQALRYLVTFRNFVPNRPGCELE
jgi:hypothetical protein